MRVKWSYTLVFLAVSGCLLGQQPKPGTSASGTFLRRSKGPMAGARVLLCNAIIDPARHQGKLAPVRSVPAAIVRHPGPVHFPGLSIPAGIRSSICCPELTVAIAGTEFDVSALDTPAKSRTPLLVKIEWDDPEL